MLLLWILSNAWNLPVWLRAWCYRLHHTGQCRTYRMWSGWDDPAGMDLAGKTRFYLHPFFLNWWCSCKTALTGAYKPLRSCVWMFVCTHICVLSCISCPWIMTEKLPGLCAQYTSPQETGLVVRFTLTYDLMRSSEACGPSPHLVFLQWVETLLLLAEWLHVNM